ncbi:hypothetical protein [Halobacterium sp. CBA1126]|uniref:hypothetical protein n=1 Tax=Halobacterium sp. CBA1126 TaxID=2668074 RepID=UPI0012FBC308|nr:hypothetical protein [Halobacterium sp. CBA1126]MUV59824.1 hypothetical protein [Halobacterium sp. CBA1126]
MQVVADTSALVSLGTVADHEWNPLDYLLDQHTVLVPKLVVDELTETATYDDTSGQGALRVLDRQPALDVRDITLDESFPLDDGENAAVTLANDCGAAQLLCDEFNQLALVHAPLVDTRLVTTPTLLLALTRSDEVTPKTARSLLAAMRDARSWTNNRYVERAETVLTDANESS